MLFRSLSCYGYHRTVTPFIDEFAKNSVLFRQAISPKYETVGVHASWFTGLYSSEHKVYNRKTKLSSSLNLLPAILREYGYQTAGFSNNPFVGSLHGMNYGFDTFYEAPTFDAVWKTGLKERLINKGLKSFGIKNNDFIVKRRAERTVEKIISWFENTCLEKSNQPFFVLTNLMDTHYSHNPPRKFLKKFVKRSITDAEIKRANKDPIRIANGSEIMTSDDHELLLQLYDANIAYVDSQLKSLFCYMKKKSLLDNTVVIITSDHGDQFAENGLYGHMLSLTDVLIHVPLIIRHPDIAGKEIDAQVGTINLFRTILSHCDINHKKHSNGRLGHDLLDKEFLSKQGDIYVFSEQERWNMPEFAEVSANKARKCVRTLYYKYIETEGDKAQLFDLKNDPDETQNIIDQPNKHLQDLKTALSNWENTLISFTSADTSCIDEEKIKEDAVTSKRLKELGYM